MKLTATITRVIVDDTAKTTRVRLALPLADKEAFRASGSPWAGRVDGVRFFLAIDGVKCECSRGFKAYRNGVQTLTLVSPHVRSADGSQVPSNAAFLARRTGARLWDVELTTGNHRQQKLPDGPKAKRVTVQQQEATT